MYNNREKERDRTTLNKIKTNPPVRIEVYLVWKKHLFSYSVRSFETMDNSPMEYLNNRRIFLNV